MGGGIAGLTLAAALDPALFDVTVYEATPERAGVGTSLGLWPAAQRALRRLVGPAARPEAADAPDALNARDARDGANPRKATQDARTTHGARHTHEARTATDRSEAVGRLARLLAGGAGPVGGSLLHSSGRRLLSASDTGVVMVDRPMLLAALAAAVPSEVQIVPEAVDDPRSLAADLVVGADGVRSVVRGLVSPRAAARIETPFVVLRGRLPAAPAAQEVGEYWGGGLLFGIVPVESHAYWFTAHRSRLGPEPLDPRRVAAEALANAGGAAPIVRSTLSAVDEATLATRLWVTPPLTRYTRGRYIVIGDAAHAMTPNLGRGANDAILDAESLAGALTRADAARRTSRVGRGGAGLDRAVARRAAWSRRAWLARRVPPTQAARVASGALMRVALAIPGRWE